MTSSIAESPMVSATADEQKQADLAKLDELFQGARAEYDNYMALMRRTAAVVYRCGALLAPALIIAKKHRINRFDLLEKYGIADSTARQAVMLYQNATAAGYTAEDLENRPITEAKLEFRVIKSPAQIQGQANHQREERKLKEEAAGSKEDGNKKSPEEVAGKGGGKDPTAPVALTAGPEAEVDDGGTVGDQDFEDIEISDLLAFRQTQLDEQSLVRWNEERERPFNEERLLVLFDLGVLSIENGKVRYLPDQEDDREELVSVLGDNLAPILDRWTSADDVMAALKDLVFANEGMAEATETRTNQDEPQKKRRAHVRRSGAQTRA